MFFPGTVSLCCGFSVVPRLQVQPWHRAGPSRCYREEELAQCCFTDDATKSKGPL